MTALTARTSATEAAEEAAIALAATTSVYTITVLTDSQAARRNYLRGRISKTTLRILKTIPRVPEIQLV